MTFEQTSDSETATQPDDASVTDDTAGDFDDSTEAGQPAEDCAQAVRAPRPKQERYKKSRAEGKIVTDRELMDAILKCGGVNKDVNEQSDDLDNFAKSTAQTLRRLPARQQAWAKVKITQLLYEAEFGGAVVAPTTTSATELSVGDSLSPGFGFGDPGMSAQSILQQAMLECGIPFDMDAYSQHT